MQAEPGRLARAWDRLIGALAAFAALLLGAMALAIGYDVVMRYFLAAPTSWSNDFSEYTLVWATFLAAPWLARKNGHVRIDVFTSMISPAAQAWLGRAVGIGSAIVCAIGAWQTAAETWDVFARGLMVAKTWAVPQWLPYVAMPLGFALTAIEFARAALRRHPTG